MVISMNRIAIIGGIVAAAIILVSVYSISFNENQVEVSEANIEPTVTESGTDTTKHYSIELDDGVGITEP